MKQKFVFTAIIAFLGLAASAQIKKGSLLFGGQISYNNANKDWNTVQPDQKNKFGLFNISAGMAIKENLVAGVYGGYGQTKMEAVPSGAVFINSKTTRVNAGVFIRQYKKLARDFYFFGELGGGYLSIKQKDALTTGANEVKRDESGAEVFITPGLAYRVYKKVHLELLIPQIAGLRYSVLKTKSTTENSSEDRFQFNTNLTSLLSSVGVGFRVVL